MIIELGSRICPLNDMSGQYLTQTGKGPECEVDNDAAERM
jgi:hypothetical protein